MKMQPSEEMVFGVFFFFKTLINRDLFSMNSSIWGCSCGITMDVTKMNWFLSGGS